MGNTWIIKEINVNGNLNAGLKTRNEFKYKGIEVRDYDYAIEQVYIINCKDWWKDFNKRLKWNGLILPMWLNVIVLIW